MPDNLQSEDIYLSIRSYIIDAQQQVYSAVNAAMVAAYFSDLAHSVCRIELVALLALDVGDG